jgi:hypothetical protein
MEISSLGSQSGALASIIPQPVVQPQEQQARSLRDERTLQDAARTNDQVTLSGASRQATLVEGQRVSPQTEVPVVADQAQEGDRVEQVRQSLDESRTNDPPVPRSVARALETYSQAAALSI